MMPCPICQHNSHARSSRIISSETKERYHQCQNLNCSCTFKSMETITCIVARPLDASTPPPPAAATKAPTSRLGS